MVLLFQEEQTASYESVALNSDGRLAVIRDECIPSPLLHSALLNGTSSIFVGPPSDFTATKMENGRPAIFRTSQYTAY